MTEINIVISYSLLLLKGAAITLSVAVLSLLLATILGSISAWASFSKKKLIYSASLLYSTIIRGIPDLVLMLLVYYGGQILVNEFLSMLGLRYYVSIGPFVAGTLTIGFIFGAYMSETFRGAYLSIDTGQLEAARSFGLRGGKLIVNILLPQLFLHGLSSFTNNWLVLLKTTSLVSVLGLNDIVRMSSVAGSSTKQPFLFYMIVALVYLLFTSLSLHLLKISKNRYHLEE